MRMVRKTLLSALLSVIIFITFVSCGYPKEQPSELELFATRRGDYLIVKGGYTHGIDPVEGDKETKGTEGSLTAFIFNVTCEFNEIFGAGVHDSEKYGDYYDDWLEWKCLTNNVLDDEDSSDGKGKERLEKEHPEWFDYDPDNDYKNTPE